MKYKTVDLFAGIGGIRKGFELAGCFENVASAEIDKYACKAYKHIYGEDPYNDVTSEQFKNKLENMEYDVLLGGFPCQAFSIAGKQLGFLDETRGTLFFDVADIIKRTKPKAFLLENVEGLTKHDKGKTFKTILNILIDLGYKVVGVEKKDNELIFNSSNLIRTTKDFGIPQKRSRVFIMGFRQNDINKNYNFPMLPSERNDKIYNNLYDLLDKNVNPKYYLSEQLLGSLKKHRENHKTSGSGFGYIIVNEGENPVANTIMATGGSGKERNLIRQHVKEYNGMIVKGKKGPLNSEGIRMMTPNEWGKLQGFVNYAFIENGEDKFSLPEDLSDAQRYKLFGNSVSIPVIECMAKYMAERLEDIYGAE